MLFTDLPTRPLSAQRFEKILHQFLVLLFKQMLRVSHGRNRQATDLPKAGARVVYDCTWSYLYYVIGIGSSIIVNDLTGRGEEDV